MLWGLSLISGFFHSFRPFDLPTIRYCSFWVPVWTLLTLLLFLGACMDPPDLLLVTEFMDRGSLEGIFRNSKVRP
ncbi:hypothetical protein PAPYR_11768 [Paratrimastix pyriformis]|uniref:Protein kinase domain-containing protein n=1 Tax=Paratrimastix pyriformis TaxID=342808 RepID=A0ABQ8U348_9EUKA|nr:hypothetical protein PAPYR_11768 [Paratrimastix pyriformis]